ncbi:HAD family hydrolase [Streptomyces sp. 549]|uniref:HAD family hydrolase n=1 Tax=Streptomyces sp. 549 TaxID=3049076 RepID=UPI0024C3D3A9|nr:HAD family hydrolase [Streptomyces sp. 549]MDK1471930.1 HAD family hydrolase [Streptomyces sp. 549]
MIRRKAVLFDVDGTLVDSTYLHAVTWWEAFRQAGHTVPMKCVHRAVGMGSDKLLDHLLDDDRDRDSDDGMVRAHSALYAEYEARLAPLPGASELLRSCARIGWTVVLASSAAGPELDWMRSALDADKVIAAATTADDVKASKPAPDLVERALELGGARPEEALFVGDTVWDVEACREAGVPCIGVASGPYDEAELTRAGAVEVYRDPQDLLDRLDSSMLGDRTVRE